MGEIADQMEERTEDVFVTKNDGVDAFHLRNKAAHKPLVFKLAPLCRLDRLIMRFHGFLQFEPQVLPVQPKGFDLALPLFLRFPQPFVLFDQASILKAALLGGLCRQLEIGHGERVGCFLFLQFLDRSGKLLLQAGEGGGVT